MAKDSFTKTDGNSQSHNDRGQRQLHAQRLINKGNWMHKDRWTKGTGCTKTDGQRELDAQRPINKDNHKKTDGKGNKRTNWKLICIFFNYIYLTDWKWWTNLHSNTQIHLLTPLPLPSIHKGVQGVHVITCSQGGTRGSCDHVFRRGYKGFMWSRVHKGVQGVHVITCSQGGTRGSCDHVFTRG